MPKTNTPIDDAIETAEFWLDMWADEIAHEQSEMDEEGEGNEVDQEERKAMRALGMVVTELQRMRLKEQRFPLQEKPLVGMVTSLPGVLNRASAHCERSKDSSYLSYPITQLLEQINYLRSSESDEQALERLENFLRNWVA